VMNAARERVMVGIVGRRWRGDLTPSYLRETPTDRTCRRRR
jgi:hypothetical protein